MYVSVCVYACVCVINRYVRPLHNKARAWQDKSVAALCGCVCESGWLIDSLLGACSCKWESVDMPQSAWKRQSINCLIHLRLSFSPSFSFVPGLPFPFWVVSFPLTPSFSLRLDSHLWPFQLFFLFPFTSLLFFSSATSVAGDRNWNLYILIMLMCKKCVCHSVYCTHILLL